MSAMGMRILVVGTSSVDTKAMLGRLAKRGWESSLVGTLRKGRDLLKAFRFDLVLSTERLSDGRGYDFSRAVERQLGTLLVGVALSETWLWLPVVERGKKVLGQRALDASKLESEAGRILECRDTTASPSGMAPVNSPEIR